MFNRSRKDPNDVFTPRRQEVNERMYISRPNLEEDLKRKLLGSKHVLIYGESGSGKSWLYKKVLANMEIEWIPINMGNALRQDSITHEFALALAREKDAKKTGYTEKIYAEANAVVAKGGGEHVNTYTLLEKEPLEAVLEMINKKTRGKLSCIVLDNLEFIWGNKHLMDELGSMIVLLDDPNYAKYNCKFIIVGVPSGVLQYFSSTNNLSSIKNRLSEIPEVSKLNKQQTIQFVSNGFNNELRIKFDDDRLFDKYVDHIYWVTNGIPQSMHEYCLELSYLCVTNNYTAKENFLLESNKRWLSDALSSSYSVIESIMNSRDTRVGRRNQILYCLGLVDKNSFKTSEIETILRAEFPESVRNSALNTSQTLNAISEYSGTFIKKTAKGDNWFFTNNQHVIAIRAMLVKTPDERIDKLDCAEIQRN